MHKFIQTLFFILIVIGGSLITSLFLQNPKGFLKSSIFDTPNTEPPSTTEDTPNTEPPSTTEENTSCDIYSLSGPPEVSFTEASGPATYQIALNSSGDKNVRIMSISVNSGPKNLGAINYKHPADGNGAGIPWMTWNIQSIAVDGQSAIIKTDDYAWYGIPSNVGFPDNLPAFLVGKSPNLHFNYPQLGNLSNQQSIYDVYVVATLNNGCKLGHSFIMQVKFEDLEGQVNHTQMNLIITQKEEVVTTVRPFASLLKFRKIYEICLRGSDIDLLVDTEIRVDLKGQYRPVMIDEENFHSQQFRGELGWEHGGFQEAIPVIRDILVGTKFCATGLSPEMALEGVISRFSGAYNQILSYVAQNFNKHLIQLASVPNLEISDLDEDTRNTILIECWREKTAKEFAGFTPNKYAGFILEHAYPGCKQDMQKPKGLAEVLNENIDVIRGFVN